MEEDKALIHKQAEFFDEILDSIPASMYLQPTEEDNQKWKRGFKKNNSAEKIQELKEKAQKKRQDKFHVENDASMVDKIAERKKELEKEAEDEISVAMPLTPKNPAKSIDELKQRLQDKIALLKQNRIEKETKNPKDKQKNKKQNAKGVKREMKSESAPEEKRVKEDVKEESNKSEAAVPLAPSVSDVISNIQFGKIQEKKEVDTSLRPKAKKDIHQLLKQAQRKQEYLKKLKNSENGQKEAENMMWDDVMSKAEGHRKKDDPAMLKKSIKRMEAKKKKSQEEWKTRKNAEKRNQKQKAEKHRPGFEGRKKGFLNDKKK